MEFIHEDTVGKDAKVDKKQLYAHSRLSLVEDNG